MMTPPVAFHFALYLDDTPGDAGARFQEVSGINSELDTDAVIQGGDNHFVHQLPKAVKNPHLTLKLGLLPMAAPLLTWCKNTLESSLAQPVTARPLRLVLLDSTDKPLRTWLVADAWPVKWSVDPFSASRSDVAVELIELSCRSITRSL